MKNLLKLLLLVSLAMTAIHLRASSGNVKPGDPVTFSLVALIGDLPMTYQWSRDGTPIAGASGTITVLPNGTPGVVAAYRIPAVVRADAGVYTCAVVNDYGSIVSDTATLKVGNPPGGAQTTTEKK